MRNLQTIIAALMAALFFTFSTSPAAAENFRPNYSLDPEFSNVPRLWAYMTLTLADQDLVDYICQGNFFQLSNLWTDGRNSYRSKTCSLLATENGETVRVVLVYWDVSGNAYLLDGWKAYQSIIDAGVSGILPPSEIPDSEPLPPAFSNAMPGQGTFSLQLDDDDILARLCQHGLLYLHNHNWVLNGTAVISPVCVTTPEANGDQWAVIYQAADNTWWTIPEYPQYLAENGY